MKEDFPILKDVVYLDHFGKCWDFAERQPDEGWQDKWLDPRD